MSKAVFLDRDGTITSDRGHVHRVEDLIFLPNSIPALRMLQNAGFKLFIVTNQSGIGRGYFAEDDYHKVNEHMISELKKHGIILHEVFYCPHRPDDNCDCRKPKTKLLNLAVERHGIDLKKSFIVGDKTTDVLLGKNAGAKSILVLTSYAGREEHAHCADPDFVAKDLLEAVGWIISRNE